MCEANYEHASIILIPLTQWDKWFVVRSLLGTCMHAFVIVTRFARRGSLNRLGMCAAGVADEVVLHALD